MSGFKKGAIQKAIGEVNEAINIFNIISLDCEYALPNMTVMEMATDTAYPGCKHPVAVGYIDATARCQYNRCPFGKEKG